MSTRLQEQRGMTLLRKHQDFLHSRELAAALTEELGVCVSVADSGFRVLGYTADSPDGVRRLVKRLRRTV